MIWVYALRFIFRNMTKGNKILIEETIESTNISMYNQHFQQDTKKNSLFKVKTRRKNNGAIQ